MSIWDDPEVKPNGAFVSFDQPGDTAAGTITAIRKHRFDDGSVVPQILITDDNGDEKTITAGQVRLKALLAEQRPEVGDHVTVTYVRQEKRAGGKTLKHFEVSVRRGAVAAEAKPPF